MQFVQFMQSVQLPAVGVRSLLHRHAKLTLRTLGCAWLTLPSPHKGRGAPTELGRRPYRHLGGGPFTPEPIPLQLGAEVGRGITTPRNRRAIVTSIPSPSEISPGFINGGQPTGFLLC